MGTFGERMQREREMRSISLDEIVESTKISARMLRALEEEEFECAFAKARGNARAGVVGRQHGNPVAHCVRHRRRSAARCMAHGAVDGISFMRRLGSSDGARMTSPMSIRRPARIPSSSTGEVASGSRRSVASERSRTGASCDVPMFPEGLFTR